MRRAVELSKQSRAEKTDPPVPSVGAVLVKNGVEIGAGFRGQSGVGDHAEFALLQGVTTDDAKGGTVYTTLEPCTVRRPPKVPCARHLIQAGIQEVVIGLIDPNRTIQGDGYWQLQESGLVVSFFDTDIVEAVRRENEKFIRYYRPLTWLPKPDERSLDDWYNVINSVYLDRNHVRSPTWIFAHLVEVVGGLSTLASSKTKLSVRIEDFIPKSIGWWFALSARLGVRSVEQMLWQKFPGVCPYCLECPHNNRTCVAIKTAQRRPDWGELTSIGQNAVRPVRLNDWKKLFDGIYPSSQGERVDVIFARLTEELGELGECVRAFDVVPNSYLSEAADVFAWIMKLINTLDQGQEQEIDLAKWMFQAYPDYCLGCKQRICACPPILPTTVQRIAGEGPPFGRATETGTEAFLSWPERQARFDVSARVVVVDGRAFAVTEEMIISLYSFIREVRPAISAMEVPSSVRREVENWADTVGGLLLAHRVTQGGIDELKSWIQSSDPDLRRLAVGAMTTAAPSELFATMLARVEPGEKT